MSPDDLAEHLVLLEVSSSDDRDEMLEDLLVHCYPTKAMQEGGEHRPHEPKGTA